MSKAARQRSARERLAEERAREAARQKRLRNLTVISTAVAVIIVAIVVGYIVSQKKGGSGSATGYAGPYAPVTAQGDGKYLMAQPNATGPTMDLYEDLQCPICKEFEKTNGPDVQQLAYQGKVKVLYHLLGFVNPQGSIRAAVAAQCAADAGKFVEFHNVAYKNQPAETSALSLSKLKDFGKQAGIPSGGTFDKCVQAQAGASQASTYTKTGLDFLQKAAGPGGQAGTPSVFINGQQITGNTLFVKGSIASLIAKAGPSTPSGAPSASPSAAPSGSATPSASPTPTK